MKAETLVQPLAVQTNSPNLWNFKRGRHATIFPVSFLVMQELSLSLSLSTAQCNLASFLVCEHFSSLFLSLFIGSVMIGPWYECVLASQSEINTEQFHGHGCLGSVIDEPWRFPCRMLIKRMSLVFFFSFYLAVWFSSLCECWSSGIPKGPLFHSPPSFQVWRAGMQAFKRQMHFSLDGRRGKKLFVASPETN